MTRQHKAGTALAAGFLATALMSALPAWASVAPGGGPVTVGPTPHTYVRVDGGISAASGTVSSFHETALSEEGQGIGYLESSTDGSHSQATVSAAASIEHGGLEATAAALPHGVSTAAAEFRHRLTVSGQGAGQALLNVDLDGSFTAAASGSLNPNNAALLVISYRTASSFGGIELNVTPQGGDSASCPTSTLSGHVLHCLGGTQISRSFSIAFDLPDAGQWVSFEASMWLQALDGATVDFGQGLALSLQLPEGVQLSSATGVGFPISAVPEPSAMLLGALGLVTMLARMRARQAARA